MNSDELFPTESVPSPQWLGLEKRINRMLESIVQLRNANAQLMKENVLLKNQMKGQDAAPRTESNGEVEKLKRQYEEALKDLQQVKANLQRLETLAKDLKLEETSSEEGQA